MQVCDDRSSSLYVLSVIKVCLKSLNCLVRVELTVAILDQARRAMLEALLVGEAARAARPLRACLEGADVAPLAAACPRFARPVAELRAWPAFSFLAGRLEVSGFQFLRAEN